MSSIETAALADGVNPEDNENVLVLFRAFVNEVKDGNYSDILAAQKKFVVDFD